MLFKIVMLATYIFEEGPWPWPAPITEHLGGRLWTKHCLPGSQSDTTHRLQGCLCGTSQTHLLQRNLSSLKMVSNCTSAGSAGSAVDDISIHQGDQAAIQGGQGKQKFIIYNVIDG